MSLKEAEDNVISQTNAIPATMSVVSQEISPVNVSQNKVRFVLEPKGILSKDSVLQFTILSSGVSGTAYLPLSAGIFALIKRATMSINGKVINTQNDLGFFKGITSSYDTPSYRNQVSSLLYGINTCLQPMASFSTNPQIGKFVFSNTEVDRLSNTASSYVFKKNMFHTNNADTCPSHSIYLKDLFPILELIELPMFLLNNPVVIDLELNTQSNITADYGKVLCNNPTNVGNLVGVASSLELNDVKLYLDTIYYNNEKMEEVAKSVNAREGLYMPFHSVIENQALHTPSTPPVNEVSEVTKTDQIPMSNFRVKNIFCAFTSNNFNVTTMPVNPLLSYYQNGTDQYLGKYSLLNFVKPSQIQYRVNDTLLFNQPLQSDTHKASEASYVYNSPIYLNTGLWSPDCASTKNGAFVVPAVNNPFPSGTELFLNSQSSTMDNLLGKTFFNAINLGVGLGNENDDAELINQKPIEVTHKNFYSRTSNYTNLVARYYCEVIMNFGIRDGQIELVRGTPMKIPSV